MNSLGLTLFHALCDVGQCPGATQGHAYARLRRVVCVHRHHHRR